MLLVSKALEFLNSPSDQPSASSTDAMYETVSTKSAKAKVAGLTVFLLGFAVACVCLLIGLVLLAFRQARLVARNK